MFTTRRICVVYFASGKLPHNVCDPEFIRLLQQCFHSLYGMDLLNFAVNTLARHLCQGKYWKVMQRQFCACRTFWCAHLTVSCVRYRCTLCYVRCSIYIILLEEPVCDCLLLHVKCEWCLQSGSFNAIVRVLVRLRIVVLLRVFVDSQFSTLACWWP